MKHNSSNDSSSQKHNNNADEKGFKQWLEDLRREDKLTPLEQIKAQQEEKISCNDVIQKCRFI